MSKPGNVRWGLVSLSLSMLMPSLDTSIANVALPTVADAFNASFQEVQWIVLAYLLAITTVIVTVGRLGDILGRRPLLLSGISLFGIASLLCGAAPTLPLLILARAAQGVGAAVMMTLTVALARDSVSGDRTGSAMGLLGTMSALGTTLGPPLGGILIGTLGWRAIFLVNAPLCVLNVLLAHRYLPADDHRPAAARLQFDGLGTVLLALTLAAYTLAMTVDRGRFGALNMALLLGAVVMACLFIRAEAAAPSPLIEPTMFGDPVLSAALGMSALVATVMMATLVVGPFYLSRALGLDPGWVGIVMSAGPLVAALTGVPGGRLVDRFGAPSITVFGLIVMAAGCFGLSMVATSLGIFGYVAPIVVVTAGYALFQAANNTAIMTNIAQHRRGAIAGVLNLSRNMGLITGASVMGAIFAQASPGSAVTSAGPEAVTAGMRVTFAVATVLTVLAVVVALGVRAPNKTKLATA